MAESASLRDQWKNGNAAHLLASGVSQTLRDYGWEESNGRRFKESWKESREKYDSKKETVSREIGTAGGEAEPLTVIIQRIRGEAGFELAVDYRGKIVKEKMDGKYDVASAKEAIDYMSDAILNYSEDNKFFTAKACKEMLKEALEGTRGEVRPMECVKYEKSDQAPLYYTLNQLGYAKNKERVRDFTDGVSLYKFDFINGNGQKVYALEMVKGKTAETWQFMRPFNKTSAEIFLGQFREDQEKKKEEKKEEKKKMGNGERKNGRK